MAWDHNARNRSAEVRRVNYHEDGPSKGKKSTGQRSSGSSNGGNGGGLGPLGKVILGGIAIYIAGSIGLGWVTDTIDNVQTAIEVKNEIKEAAKREKADAKESAKAEKKLQDDINSSGYTEKFDIDIEDLEPGDFADILSNIEEHYKEDKGIDIAMENIVCVDPEVFENSANYRAGIINRLPEYDEPVAFVAVMSGLSEKKIDEKYDEIAHIKSSNLQWSNPAFNIVHQQGVIKGDKLTVIMAFYYTEE